MSTVNRRRFLIAGSALASAGCSRRLPARRPQVSIVRLQDYSGRLYDLVRRVLAEHRLDVRGQRVLLKPNLVETLAGAPVNTHPLLVHAALEAFTALGAGSVRVAEGPAMRRGALEVAEAAGYFETIPGFERKFTDLNLAESTSVLLRHPQSKMRRVYLPKEALAADLVVSLAKLKTHHWAGATLSMKNLFGMVPGAIYGWPKNILHWAGIPESVVDLCRCFPRTFAIVDGIVGMEGDGPIYGRAKPAGVLVAGASLPAVDATCCRIMGLDPGRLAYLRLSGGPGVHAPDEVQQAAERIESVRTRFELIPEMAWLRAGSGPS